MKKEGLQRFCSVLWTRQRISTPWSAGDYTYATDGRVMVRVARLADVPEREDAPILKPGCETLAPIENKPAELGPLPHFDAEPRTPCVECRGTGRRQVCPHCRRPYEHYEMAEGHTDDMSCGECDGVGSHRSLDPVRCAGGVMGAWYCWLLGTLPGVRVGLEAAPGTRKDARYIEFEGGVGIIMMLKPHFDSVD